MVRGKFSMKNTRISLDAYKIEYIRRFGIRKITAQGRLSIHGQSPLSQDTTHFTPLLSSNL